MIETLGEICKITNTIVTIFLAICGLLVTLYAIYIGIQFAKAQDETARSNAKKQLIYAIIGVLSISVIIAISNGVMPLLRSDTPSEMDELMGAKETYVALSYIINLTCDLFLTANIVFAIFTAWQFMKASDESKRQNAKKALLYSIIGSVAIVMVNYIGQIVFGSL